MKLSNFPSPKPCRRSFYAGVKYTEGSSDLHWAVNFKDFVFDWNRPTARIFCQHDTDSTYAARILEYRIFIAPSPQWLQNLLMNEGIRPINNVVDVTSTISYSNLVTYMPLTWHLKDWYSCAWSAGENWCTLMGKCVTWKQTSWLQLR